MALMTSLSPRFQNSIYERGIGSKSHGEDIFKFVLKIDQSCQGRESRQHQDEHLDTG